MVSNNSFSFFIVLILSILLIGSSIVTVSEAASTCPNGLVSYWRLDETSGFTAADSANGNDGAVVNGENWVPGKVGNGYDFTGPSTINELTILAWFKADDFDQDDGRIISKATGLPGDSHFWMLSTRGAGGASGGESPYRVRFRVRTGSTTTTLTDADATADPFSAADTLNTIAVDLQTDIWYFAAATYDGTDMKIYVDGTLVASTSKTGDIAESGASVWIGDNPPTAGSRPFDGLIDEVAVFKRALTLTEIQSYYNSGNGKPICDTTCPDGLISYWRFDETSGTTASDSADGFDGSVNGATFTAGKINNALNFDGSNDYVNVGTFEIANSFINVGNFDVAGSLTITAWFKADTFTVNDGRIISKATSQAEAGHWWMLSTRGFSGGSSPYRMRFRVKLDGTTRTLIDGGGTGSLPDLEGTNLNLNTDTWYFVVAVYDGSEMRIYIDGILYARATASGAISQNSAVSVRIGDNPGADRKEFDGIIDEVAIFNIALSQSDIDALYNTGLGKAICITADATDSTGTIKDIFTTDETVYATGSGFTPGTSVDVYIVRDLAWNDGRAIPEDVSTDGMNTVVADSSGNLGPTAVWSPALTNGEYDMVFDINQNGQYDAGIDVVDHPDHPGFTVGTFEAGAVGGFYTPINKLSIIAPYLLVIVGLSLTAIIASKRRRKN
ncbi:LamG domain-containing protein [[Eubacterium] cellulosolvens]